MAISDAQFRIVTLGGGIALVAVMSALRFCGGVSLPPKPPPPAALSGTEEQLIARTQISPTVYVDYLKSDAAAASITAPTLQDMRRKLAYHGDESTHSLAPGDPPIEVAGVRLHLEVSGEAIVLKIDNLLPTDLAYEVTTSSSLGTACNSARALPFDAMVLHKGGSETRTECVYRTDAKIVVSKVETIELPPLSSYYIEHVRRRSSASTSASPAAIARRARRAPR